MADIRKVKLPNGTTYNIKDNTARSNINNIVNGTTKLPYGKSLSITNNQLNLLDPNSNVLSTVTLPTFNIHYFDPIEYSNDQYTFYDSSNPSIKDGDIVVFNNNRNNAILLDMKPTSDARYIELVDGFTDTVYRLYNKGQRADSSTDFGKIKAINTNSKIIAKAVYMDDIMNFEIIDIIPIYDNSSFKLYNYNTIAPPAMTDNLAGNNSFISFSYLYTYTNPDNILIFDDDGNDITDTSTLWMAVGITTAGLYNAFLYIKTTNAVRIKKIQCQAFDYGIPRQYVANDVSGYFEHITSSQYGPGYEQFEIASYSYLDMNAKNKSHVIQFVI